MAGQVDERPVRLPALYRQQEGAILFAKLGVEGRDKPLPRIEQRLERHRLASHLPELSVIEAGDVPAPRSKKLRNRPVVTDQVHEKGLEQVPADTFPVQQQRDVEQVARMLPVERRAHLARIDIVEGQEPVLGVAEAFLDCRDNLAHLGGPHRAARDRRDLDLDATPVQRQGQLLRIRRGWIRRLHPDTGNGRFASPSQWHGDFGGSPAGPPRGV